MESREKYLSELRDYIDKVESEVAIVLQSLQWTRTSLLKPIQTDTCKYDSNHIMPVQKLNKHEKLCYLKSKGYSKEDLFLPEPLDPSAPTVVKLTSENIKDIIEKAAKSDPLFKRGTRNESEALTLARLQGTFTADERRAIHDAVVKMVPSCHDLVDLTLASDEKGSKEVQKSREQILAELRDTKRRRPRYRGLGQRNYSHELRQVIDSQMELYIDAIRKRQADFVGDYFEQYYPDGKEDRSSRHTSRDKQDRRKERSYGREGRILVRHGRGRSIRDSYDDRRSRDDHSERKRRKERDSCSSSSKNGKRKTEYDRRRSYDRSHKYEKHGDRKYRQ